MYTAVFSFLVLSVGWARPAPEDYRAILDADLGRTVSMLNGTGKYRDAIRVGGRIQRSVDWFPRVSYEIGYAHHRLGELDAAVRNYDAALLRDPRLTTALYDRGEIHLQLGRLQLAKDDFLLVAEQNPTHWAGHFRLAHLAGIEGDADDFERHLMNAMQHGFDLETMMPDPDWIEFSRKRSIRPVLRKVIVLYGNDALMQWLGEQP